MTTTNTSVNGFKLMRNATITRSIPESWTVYRDKKCELYLGTVRKIRIQLESYEPPILAWSYFAVEVYGHKRIIKQRVYNTRCEAVMGLAKLRKLID